MPAFWKTVFSGVGEEPSPEAVAAAGPAETAATIIRQRTSVTRRSAFISMARTPRGVKTALRSYIDRPTVKGSDQERDLGTAASTRRSAQGYDRSLESNEQEGRGVERVAHRLPQP